MRIKRIIAFTGVILAMSFSLSLPTSVTKPIESGINFQVGKVTYKDLEVVQLASAELKDPIPVSPQDYVRIEAKKYGWSQGSQWDALYKLVSNESGFRPTAQNKSSTAYGMFQFLDSTWGSYDCHKTSDPAIQSQCGLKYIKARYGSASDALATWQSRCGSKQGCWF